MKILKKLSMAALNNFKKDEAKNMVKGASEPVFVGRILGEARKFEIGQSTYGPFFAFKGEFRGWDIRGEECAAIVAFLPDPVDSMLADQISAAQSGEGNANKSVQFGFDLYITEDKGEVGYKYVLKPLLETRASDPVATLAAQVAPLKLAQPKEGEQLALGNDDTTPETPAETPAAATTDAAKGSDKATTGKGHK